MLSQVLQSICCAGIDAALAPSHSRQGHLVCVRYRSPCQRLHLEPKLFLPEPHDPCFVIISHGQGTEGSILDHKFSHVDVSPQETPMGSGLISTSAGGLPQKVGKAAFLWDGQTQPLWSAPTGEMLPLTARDAPQPEQELRAGSGKF